MSWHDDLPTIMARRLAWQDKHGAALKERDAKNRQDRAHVADLISRGLSAINASAADRHLVFDKTGFGK